MSLVSLGAACGILIPQPGIKPISPALQGGFLTTGPLGKSQKSLFKKKKRQKKGNGKYLSVTYLVILCIMCMHILVWPNNGRIPGS